MVQRVGAMHSRHAAYGAVNAGNLLLVAFKLLSDHSLQSSMDVS
jgi:hypothetical protein